MKTNFILVTTASLALSLCSALAGSPDAKDMKGMAPQIMAESDAGPYVAAFGGANVSQDYGNNRTVFTDGPHFTFDGNSSNHIGGVGGIKAGYNFESMPLFGDFRLQLASEFEAYYVGTRLATHTNLGGADDFSLHGNLNDGAFMLNGIARFKNSSKFTPYIGIGIGTEYITLTKPTATDEFAGNDPIQHNANTFAGAVQALGGIDFEFAKHWDLFTEYKYLVALYPDLDMGDLRFPEEGGGTFNFKFNPDDFGQHLVTAGVKYNF